ncbi:MAG: site-specific integrase [Bacteroidales bacterium]|nr:site-specific integrase [Anaerotignum sp.]MCI5679746.1 site-specific integrase [Bacteroidales bacterium]MDY3927290.1 site-specific integrase [Anaerotignum sp.]
MNGYNTENHFYDGAKEFYDLLKFAVENGKVDVQQIQEEYAMIKKQELLNKHPYNIYLGKDGKWYTYLPDKEKKRVKVKRTTKQAIEEAVIDYWQKETHNPTLDDVFQAWNDRRLLLKQISDATHLRSVRIFNRYYGDIRDVHIKDVTPNYLEDFLERQIPKYNLTAKDFANLKSVTKGFFKKAKKDGLVTFNVEQVYMDMDVSDNAFRRVVKEDCDEVYNEDETKIIMEYLHKNLDIHNMGILLMFVTGLRVGELSALTPKDLQIEKITENKVETVYGKVLVSKTETKYLKDGKAVFEVVNKAKTEAGMRTVIVPPDYIWLLKRLLRQNPFGEYVFMYNGKRMKEEAFRKRLQRVCKNLGIKYKSPHKIRKTYGTILMDNEVGARFITNQMGHTDISCTTEHYYRNRKTDDRKAMILNGILEFQDKQAQ